MTKINMKRLICILLLSIVSMWHTTHMHAATPTKELTSTFWSFQSIDTMKYSRDTAREKAGDLSYDAEIDEQMKKIKATGATHVAIGTPYDEEFIPYMNRWVNAARQHGLKVWFRGNLAGWEEWFEYPPIDRDTHTEGVREFILNNPDLFQDGDVFTSCPECENGGPGDPRFDGDVESYRAFLISEYNVVKSAFTEINKDVKANYYSMNGDVAKLVMDKETTKALDGIVTVDHYVTSVDQLITDINEYEQLSGGKVVLGEWGAPIPDIHGDMTEEEQAKWIHEALLRIVNETDIEGLNYWTHQGSSTGIWNDDGSSRAAVATITMFYNPKRVSGEIRDAKGSIVNDVQVITRNDEHVISHGRFAIPLLGEDRITFKKTGYKDVVFQQKPEQTGNIIFNVIMVREDHSFWQKLIDYFYILFHGNGFVYVTMKA